VAHVRATSHILFSGVFNLIGLRAGIWLSLSVIAGLTLSFAESQLASFIQLFLKSLGIAKDIEVGKFWLFPETSDLGLLLGFLSILIFLRALAQFLVNQSATVALESLSSRMRTIALYDLLLNKSARYVSAADTNSKFAEIFPKASLCIYYSTLCLPQILISVVMVILLFMTSAFAAGISLLGIVIIGLGVLFINFRIRRIAWRIPREQKSLSHGVERVTRNWLLVRILGTAESEFDALNSNVRNYAKNSISAAALGNLSATVPQTLGGIFLVGIILYTHSSFVLSSAALLSFLYLFLRLTQTLAVIANYFGGVLTYFPQLKASLDYCATFEKDEGTTVDSAINHQPNWKGEATPPVMVRETHLEPPSIVMSHVSFSYSPEVTPVFQSLSLAFESGQQTGIVGRSGSGKSTLLCILVGLLRPQCGYVKIDGSSAEHYCAVHRESIGFVGAEAFIVAGSIKDNLDYGATSSYTSEDYEIALRQASLFDFILALPNGIHYQVAENGAGLSAGQKQRLAIARALLRKPKILLLDEVTANLDSETESEIARSISELKGKTTVIFISHRREALKYADKIVDVGA
jgi:ABC-type bacteriocin/lantibiotic exporter with double-glycine peptidase domain